MILVFFFFFKQKTAYEVRISDWSSDVCSSDLRGVRRRSLRERAIPTRCVAAPPRAKPLSRRSADRGVLRQASYSPHDYNPAIDEITEVKSRRLRAARSRPSVC